MRTTIEQRKYAKGLAVREQVVAAASQLFSACGYGGCSVAELAQAAKVSRNQLFHHFSSKENLALACIQRAQQELEDEIITPAAIHPNPINQLVYSLDRINELQQRGWPFMHLIATFAASEGALPASARQEVADVLKLLFQYVRGLLKEAKKANQLPGGGKARIIAAQFLAAMLGAAALSGFGEQFHPADILVQLRESLGSGAIAAAI